jgi:hypothetical protein
MFKIGSHYSFGHLKHKLWPKKVGNQPNLLGYMGCATYRWKDFDESYNFSLDRIAIQGMLAKSWGSKVARVPFSAISGLPLRNPGREKPFGCRLRG